MTDDLFRSMKAQMEPSDDVVADLLAKIQAEAASPVTENENENVIPFRQPAETGSAAAAAAVATGKEPARKNLTPKKKKSIWYYGTAVAACIIVFISTFALLDSTGDPNDPNTLRSLLGQVIGSGTTVTPDNPGDETQTPDQPGGSDGEVQGSDSEKEDGEKSFWETLFHPEDKDDDNQPSDNGDSDQPGGNGGEKTDSNDGSGSDSNHSSNDSNSSGNQSQTGSDNQKPDDPSSNPDDANQPPTKPDDSHGNGNSDNLSTDPGNGKVTPGSAGTSDIPWTSEIMYTSEVASINVSGSNYVVESTASASDLSATIETVTIDLPTTSSTNATKVHAKVKALKKVSTEAMVALDVDGFTQPLVYTNADYSPDTLGQLVSDLGLVGNTRFSSTLRCQISRVGYSSNHTYKMDISSAAWDYLLGNSDAGRANYGSFSNGNIKVLFTSNSNPTGSQIQFGVSDNGYLYVSMVGGNRFTFRIGSAQARSFIEYVTGEPVKTAKEKNE